MNSRTCTAFYYLTVSLH